MTPDLAVIACRFLRAASAMLLWGTCGYLSAFVPAPLADEIARRLAPIRRLCVLACVIATLALLPALAASIGDGWSDALNGATLSDVVLGTGIGRAWLWQSAAVLLLAASEASPSRGRLSRTAMASGLVLASLALGGHAVMQSGLTGTLHQLVDAVHVLAAGAWFGALLPLLPILTLLTEPRWKIEAGLALRSFSTAGHIAVALALFSGAANALLVAGWPLGPTSTYRALLLGKIAAVSTMVLIAVANRYALVPRLGRTPSATVAAIRLGTLAEIGFGLAAIALVAAFGMMDPA